MGRGTMALHLRCLRPRHPHKIGIPQFLGWMSNASPYHRLRDPREIGTSPCLRLSRLVLWPWGELCYPEARSLFQLLEPARQLSPGLREELLCQFQKMEVNSQIYEQGLGPRASYFQVQEVCLYLWVCMLNVCRGLPVLIQHASLYAVYLS